MKLQGNDGQRKPSCGEFCSFCSKTLLYISFGCGCNKMELELSGVEFVVVVVVVVDVAQL